MFNLLLRDNTGPAPAEGSQVRNGKLVPIPVKPLFGALGTIPGLNVDGSTEWTFPPPAAAVPLPSHN